MTGGLAWLNDLMVWLGRWIPRLLLIHPTHRGVRFGPTGFAREVGPGLVLYWPISHVIIEVPITTQSVQLCAQLLPAERVAGEFLPRVTICGAAIQFRVVDAVRAATSALNIHAVIDNRASAAIMRHVALAPTLKDWAAAVCVDLAQEMANYGVHLERLDFTQVGVGVALKNLSDWSYSDGTDGKRPS